MLKRIASLSKKPFVRNVAVVASSTAAAQIISMVFVPIVTRLYGPEAFGVQGVFMSIAIFMANIAAMMYPTAIVLPESDEDAKNLCWLSIIIAIGTSCAICLLIFLFGDLLLKKLNAQEISSLIYLLPIYTLVAVLTAVCSQWLIRKLEFNLTAKINIVHTLLINLIKVGQGLVSPTALALILINSLAGLLSAVMMLFGLQRSSSVTSVKGFPSTNWQSILRVAKQFQDFPYLRTPQVLLNSISQLLPVMLLSIYFGPKSVGHYSLAVMVLAMPARLVGDSVMQVFYPRIAAAIRVGEDARALIFKATIGLALSGLVPLLIIVITGPLLFGFVFGADWKDAGVYAQWLSVFLYFQYINKPAVSAIPSLKLQGGLLVYEIFSTTSKVAALYFGYFVFGDDVIAIAIFSGVGVLFYICLIAWVIVRAKNSVSLTN